jgi:glucose/arabinose dehydrogenase
MRFGFGRRAIFALALGAMMGLAGAGIAPGGGTAQEASPVAAPVQQDQLTLVASGLTNGRSFAWGPDGALYVAAAGVGGDNAGTIEAPVVHAVGTLYGGKTASVVRIENGCPVTVAPNLPSTRDEAGITVGAAAVAFLDGQMYVLQCRYPERGLSDRRRWLGHPRR